MCSNYYKGTDFPTYGYLIFINTVVFMEILNTVVILQTVEIFSHFLLLPYDVKCMYFLTPIIIIAVKFLLPLAHKQVRCDWVGGGGRAC